MSNRSNKYGVREALKFMNFTPEDRKSVSHTLDPEFEPVGNPKPTDYEPGSIEKIYVLQQRVMKGEPMFVAGDAFLTHKMRNRDEFTERMVHYTPRCFQRQSCLDSY